MAPYVRENSSELIFSTLEKATAPTRCIDAARLSRRHPAQVNDAACDAYDDTQDHDRCTDCKGTGWYIGFTERRYCPTCDGSGYL